MCFNFGRHADDRAVGEQQQQPRIRAPHGTRIDLLFEERNGAVHQRLQPRAEIDGRARAKPADLAHQSEELRPAHRKAEHRAHHGVETLEPRAGRRECRFKRRPQLVGAVGDRGVEQRLLRRIPVENGLFAYPQFAGQRVERGRLEPSGAELLEGHIEDAFGGPSHEPSVDNLSTIW